MPNTAEMSGNNATKSLPEIEASLSIFQTPEAERITSLLQLANSEQAYEKQVELFESLMSRVPDEPDHPLNWLLTCLGELIATYEQQQFSMTPQSPEAMLAYLMEIHALRQSDLPEVGNQAKVSEILSGKRQLNRKQIEGLCKRFKLSASTFLPTKLA